MRRSLTISLMPAAAGVLVAAYLVLGRWGPGQLLGIGVIGRPIGPNGHFVPYTELNWPMFVELRHPIVLALLLLTALAIPPRGGPPPGRPRRGSAGVDAIFGIIAAMYGYLLLSALWASDSGVAALKGYEVLLALAATWAIWRWATAAQAAAFRAATWGALMGFTLFLAAMGLMSIGGGRLAVMGGGPNIFGRLMCYLMIGGLGLAGGRRAALPVPVVALALLVMTGSRGAMLGAAAGLLAFILADRGALKGKAMLIGAMAVCSCGLILFTPLGDAVVGMFEDRVQRLTFEKGYTAGRDEIVQEAYERGMESPLTGTGLGGSAGVGGSEYPHNLPLELFCEGGIAPVLLLAAALLAFGGACWAYRGTCKAADIATFAAIFVASQFSGDLYDSRAVFAFMILAAVPVDVGRWRPRRSGGDPPAKARVGHAASVRPGDSSGG